MDKSLSSTFPTGCFCCCELAAFSRWETSGSGGVEDLLAAHWAFACDPEKQEFSTEYRARRDGRCCHTETVCWKPPGHRYCGTFVSLSLDNYSASSPQTLDKWHAVKCLLTTVTFHMCSSGDWWCSLSRSTKVEYVAVWKHALSNILSFWPAPRSTGTKNLVLVLQCMYDVSIMSFSVNYQLQQNNQYF